MHSVTRQFVDFFTSLRLTIALLALSIILIFVATLDQVNLGIWAVQEKYFRTFIVLWKTSGGFPIPVFPGGYFIGSLLLVNLIAAHVYRFRLTWKKFGIHLVHLGLILLLVGELLTGLFSEESAMRIDEGSTTNFSESFRKRELAIVETTARDYDEVTSIPVEKLPHPEPITHGTLPFSIRTLAYFPNSGLARITAQTLDARPASTNGLGASLQLFPQEITYKEDEQNHASAVLEFVGKNGESHGSWLVSTVLGAPQKLTIDGRTFEISLRPTRYYKDFSLTLIDFTHERYAGTDTPKNFASRVRLQDQATGDNREVIIYMNNPLRHGGFTFFQASFDNNDTTTVFQVVQNPSWLIPYIACLLATLGLLFHFILSLTQFIERRASKPSHS